MRFEYFKSRWAGAAALAVAAAGLAAACKEKPETFTTTVEVMQVRAFGTTTKLMDLEVKFAECPADARHVMRLGKDFTDCDQPLKAGDKVKADVTLTWNQERGFYRNDIVKLGKCNVKLDRKDEANYQTVEVCSDVKASGIVVGVRCERTRSPELLAKCPWLRRN
jgi:hypothetical protein